MPAWSLDCEYTSLQWGRAHKDAEGRMRSPMPRRHTELQWGRAHKDAEGALERHVRARAKGLQWGRAHKDAEGTEFVLSQAAI